MLVSKENFVLFTPMLHEVAGSDVEAADVVQPLRKMLRHTRVVIAEIESIDLAGKTVRILRRDLAQSFDLSYDHVVLALGSITNFYRTPGIEQHALTMKTLGDAIVLRNRVIEALDVADNHPDETERKRMLTVVVTGGGFAGVETVGAVNDLLREAMKFYRNLRPDMLRVVLVQGGDAILPELGERLGRYAQQKLQERGVEVRLKTAVSGYDGKEVVLSDGTQNCHPPGRLDSGSHTLAPAIRAVLRRAARPHTRRRISCACRAGRAYGRSAIVRSCRTSTIRVSPAHPPRSMPPARRPCWRPTSWRL